jgi:outer membrane protein, heavy metal efflux system
MPLRLSSVFLWSLSFAFVSAAETPPLPLDEAIRLAWRHDPAAAAFAIAPELAHARVIQAGTRPNPELELSASSPSPLRNDSEWAVGAAVKQRLPRRDRVERAQAVARLGAEAAPWRLRAHQARLASEVRSSYYTIILHQARRELAQRHVVSQQELQAAWEARRGWGEVAGPDLEVLAIELARAEQTAALAAAELAGEEQRLRRLLRWHPREPLRLAADLDALLARPLPDPAEANRDTRPEVALATLAVKEAQAALALAEAESRSDWTVGGGLEFERRTNDATGRLENEPRLLVQAAVPWPRRIPNRGERLERQVALRLAEAERDATLQQLMNQASARVLAAEPLRAVLLERRESLGRTAALSESLRAAYERGEVTSLQLAQARQQRAALEAEWLDLAARYAALLAEAETAAALMPDEPSPTPVLP